MRLKEIRAKMKGRFQRRKRYTAEKPPNLQNQNFEVSKPNEIWLADITHIKTLDRWLYIAAILDLFSRRIVGLPMSNRMQTDLVKSALQQAVINRKPGNSLIHHSVGLKRCFLSIQNKPSTRKKIRNKKERKNMTINIKTALHKAQTYQELVPITKELCAGLSRWGYQYATATAQSAIYQGTIAIGSIAEKAMKIRQRMEQNAVKFTPEERENVILLSREISRLYGEDTVNCERAGRITTLCRLAMSLIFWVNHQSKWNSNANGPSYREQLQRPLSISLKTAINKAQNFQELLYITNKLHAGLSWWGHQYAYVPNTPSADADVIYTGRITIGAMAKKALKIRQEMTKNEMGFVDEEKSVESFCKKIYCLYAEDKNLCNQANRLTSIFRSVVQLFFWANHRHRWGAVWDYSNKVETHPEIIYRGFPGYTEENPVKGYITRAFIENLIDYEELGATYIPYPNPDFDRKKIYVTVANN